MEELEKVKSRYEKRKLNTTAISGKNAIFVEFVKNEREKVYSDVLNRFAKDVANALIIEIGAGTGGNISFFMKYGFQKQNIYANELLEDRFQELKKNYPEINIFPGDARELPFTDKFDVVFQSTVFTSILDFSFKKELASKMWKMVKPGGIILWYDFIYNNPKNKDVKGISRAEIGELFPGKIVESHSVTLAPPIGRRIGKLYPVINGLFPFLRTHLITVIQKNN